MTSGLIVGSMDKEVINMAKRRPLKSFVRLKEKKKKYTKEDSCQTSTDELKSMMTLQCTRCSKLLEEVS